MESGVSSATNNQNGTLRLSWWPWTASTRILTPTSNRNYPTYFVADWYLLTFPLSIKIMRFSFLFSGHTGRFECSRGRRLLFLWRFSLVWCWGWRLLPFYLACFGTADRISRFLSRLWSLGCRWRRTRRSSSCSSSGRLALGGVSPCLRKWVWNLQFSNDVRNRCIRRSLASCPGLPP